MTREKGSNEARMPQARNGPAPEQGGGRLKSPPKGRYVQTLSTDRLDGMVELLAHHFGRSTEDDKAVEYAIRAAEKAQPRWANSETFAYLEAAVARLEAMPDTL